MSNFSSLFAVKPVNINEEYSKSHPIMLNQGETYKHSSNWIGAAITAAGGLLGGLFGNSQAKKSAKLQLKNQQTLMADQYQYNLRLQNQSQIYNRAAEDRARAENRWLLGNQQAFERDNMALQSQYAKENWQYAFDQENAYNDPSAQRARLEAAGYNPQLANGTVNTLGGSGMNAMPSAESPAAAASPAIPSPSNSVGLGSAQSIDLASGIKNIMDSGAQLVSTAINYGLSKQQVKKIANEAKKTSLEADYQELLNKIQNMPYYGEDGQTVPNPDGSGRPLSVAEAKEQGLTVSVWKQVEKIGMDIENGKWDKILKQQDYDFKNKTNPTSAAILEEALNKMGHEIDLIDSQVEVAHSTSRNLDQDTKRSKELLPFEKQNLQASAYLSREQARDLVETREARINNFHMSAYASLWSGNLSRTNIYQVRQDVAKGGYRWKDYMNASIDKLVQEGNVSKQNARKLKDRVDQIINLHGKAQSLNILRLFQDFGIYAEDLGGGLIGAFGK